MTKTSDCPNRTLRERILFGLAKIAAIFLVASGALVTLQTYRHEGDLLHLIVAAFTTMASLALAIIVFKHDASRSRSVRNAMQNIR